MRGFVCDSKVCTLLQDRGSRSSGMERVGRRLGKFGLAMAPMIVRGKLKLRSNWSAPLRRLGIPSCFNSFLNLEVTEFES